MGTMLSVELQDCDNSTVTMYIKRGYDPWASYFWEWGDGNIGYTLGQDQVIHYYTEAGTYMVKLTDLRTEEVTLCEVNIS